MDKYIRKKFPYFRSGTYIYLDNAATTQVHGGVIQAVLQTLEYRGNPYRGSHAIASANQQKLETAREKIAGFIGAGPHELVLTSNTTDGLNLAVDSLAGSFGSGDEVLVAKGEHNSNLLPYLKLKDKGVTLKHFALSGYYYDLDDIKNKLSPNTKLVALQHCSNVSGAVQPVEEAVRIIKEYNKDIIVIIDGAQAVAHLPVDIKKIGCDAYAFSGHKMYGPDGIGVLYIDEKLHSKIAPVKAGGGTVSSIVFSSDQSKDYVTPEYKPGLSVLEGGTPNLANAVGLQKAIGMFKKLGWDQVTEHESLLTKRLLEGLAKLDKVEVIKPAGKRIGVVSFYLKDQSLNLKLSQYLNKNKIAIRFGSHCAFGLAEEIESETLRASFAVYNTEEEVDKLIELLAKFIKDYGSGNERLDEVKNISFSQKEIEVNSFQKIQGYIKQLADHEETNIVVMCGHFLAVPDFENNTFWPSIKPMLPQALHRHLEEFGMSEFPLATWKLGTDLAAQLKDRDRHTKLIIVANETTGINELRLSESNKEDKAAEDYRKEILQKFYGQEGLPEEYQKILSAARLDKSDILKADKKNLCFRESVLRDRFQKFIRQNKNYFQGIIDYTMNKHGELDIEMNALKNPDIKTCVFNSFDSKTGGKFCIAEVVELLGEIFGRSDNVDYEYLSSRIFSPKMQGKKNIFVIFSPAMCNNAVNRAAELYIKVFLGNNSDKEFHFVNIPLGPDSMSHLRNGTTMTHISNK